MLVLTREVGETIVIRGDITVKVVDVVKGRVRLGLDAPDDVGIVRGELLVVDDAAADAHEGPAN